MKLSDAKTQLGALPGVYEVKMFLDRDELDSMPEYVKFYIRIASPEILPEETRQGILCIQERLEREFGCFVSFSVSAGLRMPDWASS